ncbi:MAG TPA: hypothetical protein QGF58_27515 [Myxococcota bacterium]|nr:hypothetical protein [Myxococcota bacterium]
MIWLLLGAWTPKVEQGPVDLEAVEEWSTLIRHCPSGTSQWVARYQDGRLEKLGMVGTGEVDRALESCLEAGLRQRAVEGDVLVRIRWTDDTREAWERQSLAILDQIVGPREVHSCATLRFPIGAEGVLGAPTLHSSSSDEALDRLALDSVAAFDDGMPPVPESLRAVYGDHVDLCVGGIPK